MDSTSLKIAAKLSMFIFFFSSPFGVFSNEYSSFSMITLPPGVADPVAIAFDLLRNLYIGVADGRILKWQGPNIGFADFAYTSPTRTKPLCDCTTDPDKGPVCGKPLGFSFNYVTGELYIVDAYWGLQVVGPEGGLATQLATTAEGVSFRFPSAVDVDQLTGKVYLTLASDIYELRNASDPKFATDSTGRLLRYDPRTKQTTVLMKGLARPTGVAVTIDSTWVVFSEYNGRRIQRFWLTGPKANTAEIFLNLPGNPFKIKRTALGDFWVAVSVSSPGTPRLTITPIGQKFDAFATVQAEINFSAQYPNKTLSVIVEQGGALYTGSREVSFVGVYKN